jgi:Uma2 family endonuclease
MIEADEHIELLDGLIVTMPPIGIPHWTTHARIVKYLIKTFNERAAVAGDISIPLGKRNEPYPDIAVLANLPYARPNSTPEPSQIYAMVELADSSLAKDTFTKRRIYGRFAIADYVVVDQNANVVLHFSHPVDGDYPEPRRLELGDVFTFSALPDIELEAGRFLVEP